MIYEDYCSKELCMLLKEKGINAQFKHAYYNPDEDGCRQHYCKYSHAIAMKWLREVHKLHIWIGYKAGRGLPWYYEIHNMTKGKVEHIGGMVCGSYEKAVEAALKYSLENLIKL